jgi:hypothetical protein
MTDPVVAAMKSLDAVLPLWHRMLQHWAKSNQLLQAAEQALGLAQPPEALLELIRQFSAADFRGIPAIQLLKAEAMGHAMGAYAISTETIYLNENWLLNAETEEIIAVLTEELAHSLDGRFNEQDTTGDEGEHFSALLIGSANDRSLFQKDDTGILWLDGIAIPVEFASATDPPPSISPPDIAPIFTSGNTAAAIDENSGTNQAVYTAVATDASAIIYTLAPTSDRSFFAINESTGVVTLLVNPDFETQSSYNFIVVATDAQGNASQLSVSLAINNLDDQAPVFSSSTTASAIDENSGANQAVYTAVATDASSITYSLAPSGDSASLSINPLSGVVTLRENPDYAIKQQYSFTVIATDVQGNAAQQTVLLNINDVDKEAPVFTSSTTANTIEENSGINQAVYTATATDVSAISYSLATAGDSASFSINSVSGVVTLLDNPDFESKAQYSFTVVATDAQGNAAQQTILLSIRDADEEFPVFTSGATASPIDENSGANQSIYTAVATDASAITYSLGNSGDSAAFSINSISGVVTLIENPNFEIQPSYSFIVVATDTRGNSTEQSVQLTINNINENAPVFTSSITAQAISENSGSNQTVYVAQATGIDVIRYSLILAEPEQSLFAINTATGAVILLENPDYELRPSYTFTVVATDAQGNASEINVQLNIGNIDEEPPVFQSGTAATAINENSGANQDVYTAVATDASAISYSLGATGDSSFFLIDGTSGVVTLKNNPDYENKNQYAFIVIATDAQGNAAEQTVQLLIKDVDEKPPVFASGPTATPIDENSGPNRVVYTAVATDASAITYSLAPTADSAAFSITPLTGIVTLKDNPDYEVQPSYSFTVIATDAKGNASHQNVLLSINDIDEEPPVFTSSTTANAIDENSGANQSVYTAAATDASAISYSLASVDDSTAFSINSTTGAVSLRDNPDYELQTSYSFTVVATDAQGNASQQSVLLNINDVDEEAPVFTSNATANPINENSGSNQHIYTAVATDASNVLYSLKVNSGDQTSFAINATTGAVLLLENPDFERKQLYTFTVIATDAENNTSELTVQLDIQNVDENQPVFTSSTTAPSINENSGANQAIYTAVAADSSPITYSLAPTGDGSLLSINNLTGVVTLTGNPNYEAKPSYTFSVIATDAQNNSSEQTVRLDILDLDEEPPVFVSAATANPINENSGSSQAVYTAVATDNSPITYSLAPTGDGSRFSINSITGVVTLTDNPNYEAKPSYTFSVIATDAQNNASEKTVRLDILDLDEEPPVFVSAATANPINENSGSSQAVYTAVGTDNSPITYSLASTGDGSFFSINSITGVVSLIDNPNYENKPSYLFAVIATDARGNVSQLTVGLSVNNLDEIPPEFISPAVADPIPTKSGSNQLVYTAEAIDDAAVRYSLKLNDGDEGMFAINVSNGKVVLLDNPDASVKPNYSFTVIATDEQGNASELTVGLEVSSSQPSPPANNGGSSGGGGGGGASSPPASAPSSSQGGSGSSSSAQGEPPPPANLQNQPTETPAATKQSKNGQLTGSNPSVPLIGSNEADELIPLTPGRYVMTGNLGSDNFIFAVIEKRNMANADIITDFTATEGDKIILNENIFELGKIRYKSAKNKKALKRLYSSKHNLLYDLSKSRLIVDLNGKTAGLGGGGTIALIDNDAKLNRSSFELDFAPPPTQML